MALSAQEREALRIALGAKQGSLDLAESIADKIDSGLQVAVDVADVATADADGTYGAPEATLINEIKAQLNALLASLRSAGMLE